MAGPSLPPRDSQGPEVWTADDGTGAFSPNNDGSQDTFDVGGEFSESAAWNVIRGCARRVLQTACGGGPTYDASWAGLVSGSPVADGAYAYTIMPPTDGATRSAAGAARYRRHRRPGNSSRPAPLAAKRRSVAATFSPNGDGVGDTISFAYDTTRPASSTRPSAARAGRRSSTPPRRPRPAPATSPGTAGPRRGLRPRWPLHRGARPARPAGNVGTAMTDDVGVCGPVEDRGDQPLLLPAGQRRVRQDDHLHVHPPPAGQRDGDPRQPVGRSDLPALNGTPLAAGTYT